MIFIKFLFDKIQNKNDLDIHSDGFDSEFLQQTLV